MLSTFSQLLLSIYRHAQECAVQDFQDRILEELKAVLPFDSSMWGTATMTPQGIDIHSVHLYKSSQAMLDAYEKVKHQDISAARITQQATATMGFNAEDEFGSPAYADIYNFCVQFGHRNCFITSDIHPRTRFVHWISLYRSDPAQVCTPRELEVLGHLAPHLMQALAINRLVHLDRLGGGDAARAHWAVAIADAKGVLYHAEPRFKELIRSEWPGSNDMQLPPALVLMLAGRDSRIVGQQVVVQRTLEHEVLFLKARQRQRVDSLSTRELIVARLLADGLTQKQVAAQLDRSPETVRTQTRVVFEKLDINTVVMLAQHLALRD